MASPVGAVKDREEISPVAVTLEKAFPVIGVKSNSSVKYPRAVPSPEEIPMGGVKDKTDRFPFAVASPVATALPVGAVRSRASKEPEQEAPPVPEIVGRVKSKVSEKGTMIEESPVEEPVGEVRERVERFPEDEPFTEEAAR